MHKGIEDNSDCGLHDDGYCILTDKPCTQVCWNSVRMYDGLEKRDYLDIVRTRRRWLGDFALKVVSVGLSVIALAISLASYAHTHYGANANTAVCPAQAPFNMIPSHYSDTSEQRTPATHTESVEIKSNQ